MGATLWSLREPSSRSETSQPRGKPQGAHRALGFRGLGSLGSRVQGLGFRVYDLGFKSLEFRV